MKKIYTADCARGDGDFVKNGRALLIGKEDVS
jgi:hypothetical protein